MAPLPASDPTAACCRYSNSTLLLQVQELQPCPAIPRPPPNSVLLLLQRQQRPVQLPAGKHQLLLADSGSDGSQLRDAVIARVTRGLGCGAVSGTE
jgi:hypothetical protein